jgi:hypothetical protein
MASAPLLSLADFRVAAFFPTPILKSDCPAAALQLRFDFVLPLSSEILVS